MVSDAHRLDPPPAAPPSGRQLRLTAGDTEATAVEVGGGLRSFRVAGADILDGYGESEQAGGGRGQVLVPWPNRVRDGQWSWAGRDLALPLSEPALHNASHGLVRWQSWHVEEVTATSARLSTPVVPQPGYPFRLLVETHYTVAPGSLGVTLTSTNLSPEPAPVGMGMHPYLTVGTDLVDAASLRLPATTELSVDERLLPVAEVGSAGWSGPIGSTAINTAFGGLTRDADGLARVVLAGPDRTVTLWLDETWRWVQAYTGETLPPDRRRRGLAIEPMTCPPDALRSGRDLVTLAPGESLTGRWGLEVS